MILADLRPAKEALIETCTKLPIRLGRLFALGSWGDAVLITRGEQAPNPDSRVLLPQ